MSTVLILGDVHLGKGTSLGKTLYGSFLNSRVVDQLNILDWVLERALEHSCSDIIITGDIFEDPKPSPSLITLFVSWVKKIHFHQIKLHIIVGNHDILRVGYINSSPLDIISEFDLENIYIYKDLDTFFIDNSAITIIPFRDRKSLSSKTNKEAIDILNNLIDYELSLISDSFYKVCIGHLAIEGSIFVGDEVDDISNELFVSLETLSKYDFTWMGHVHNHQVLKKSPYISHIGSMDISNFGESDQDKIIVLYDTVSSNFSYEIIPTRRLKKIKISIPKDTKDPTNFVISQLNEHLSNAIVKVEIDLLDKDLLPIDKKKIEQKILSFGASSVSQISENKKISLLKKENNSMDSSLDIPSAIKMYADINVSEKKKSKFIELANEIYKEMMSK